MQLKEKESNEEGLLVGRAVAVDVEADSREGHAAGDAVEDDEEEVRDGHRGPGVVGAVLQGEDERLDDRRRTR